MRLTICCTLVALGASIFCSATATAAGNLLVNGDFEATPADAYFDGFTPDVADDVPGWNMFLGAADGSYVYVNGVGSGNVDLDMANSAAGGGIETAALSRPTVTPGKTYTASLTYDNYFAPTDAAYFIDWFDSVGSLISSAGGPLADPNGPFTFAPYTQLLSVSGNAPIGSASAGVRFIAGNAGYAGLTADNFTLVPEPASLVLFTLAMSTLVGMRGRKRS
ncbi:MAG: PEP-CTERM sorting domain-containing protein [Pirellulales bacterium]